MSRGRLCPAGKTATACRAGDAEAAVGAVQRVHQHVAGGAENPRVPVLRDAAGGRDHQSGARRRVNEDYCKWCYADGKFTYTKMEDLVEFCVEHFAGENCPPEQMRAYMQQKLPKLKYWSSGAADKKI